MRKGVRAGSRTLMMHVYQRKDPVIQGGPRFGLVVSKQVGNAVTVSYTHLTLPTICSV